MGTEDGIFWHKCKRTGCETMVEFDDEPYCFGHSPDSGSSVAGYSARAEEIKVLEDRLQELKTRPPVKHQNIFEEEHIEKHEPHPSRPDWPR